MKEKLVLGIETSCDDTSICILKGNPKKVDILGHVSFTQEEILRKWGGIVPEIAARNHLQKITPLLDEAFTRAGLTMPEIDLIAVTTLPGLLGPLLTGLNAAKTLALIHQKPIVSVNHLYAHMEAIHLTQNVQYPYLGLLISGGHSVFFWVEGSNQFKVLASTIDDAAGEAFDKGGKLLGLGYPAGKIIDQLSKFGDPNKYDFPIGLKSSKDARLSFSGLKTALRMQLERADFDSQKLPKQFEQAEDQYQDFYDICASYQQAIVKALVLKTKYAIKEIQEKYQVKNPPVILGGGVACNSAIREQMQKKFQTYFVAPQFCTDNGAMIAHFALRNQDLAYDFPDCLKLDSRGRFIDKKEFN